MKKEKNLVGLRFGRLVVLRDSGEQRFGKILWECKCDCGNTKKTLGKNLVRGLTKSCGCIQKEWLKKGDANRKHGGTGTRLFKIWCGMKARCKYHNIVDSKYYADRGIVVCDEWKSDFSAFKDWALKNGYNDALTIERIDNNGNYEPHNCKWITSYEQHLNTRANHFVTINGEKKTIKEWERIIGINHGTLCRRLRAGWDDVTALTKPIKSNIKD